MCRLLLLYIVVVAVLSTRAEDGDEESRRQMSVCFLQSLGLTINEDGGELAQVDEACLLNMKEDQLQWHGSIGQKYHVCMNRHSVDILPSIISQVREDFKKLCGNNVNQHYFDFLFESNLYPELVTMTQEGEAKILETNEFLMISSNEDKHRDIDKYRGQQLTNARQMSDQVDRYNALRKQLILKDRQCDNLMSVLLPLFCTVFALISLFMISLDRLGTLFTGQDN